jgi:hypothetical protein
MDSQPYSHSHPTSLGLSRRVLTVLVKLNLLMGFLITALLIASLVAEGPVMWPSVCEARATIQPSSSACAPSR